MTTIEIEGLTEAQEIALEDMMRMWTLLGNIGASRFTSYFAAGDSDFHPKIKFNGHVPMFFVNPGTNKPKSYNPEYKMDFEEVAQLLIDYSREELQQQL